MSITYVIDYDPLYRFGTRSSNNAYINGIQIDWQHPMSPMAPTILERSSRSLMLDQELVLIHEPGIATLTLVVQCGRVLVGVNCP